VEHEAAASLHPDAVAVLAGGAALDLVPRARPSSMAACVVIGGERRGGGAGGEPLAIHEDGEGVRPSAQARRPRIGLRRRLGTVLRRAHPSARLLRWEGAALRHPRPRAALLAARAPEGEATTRPSCECPFSD
jgi:hypothetical protein